MSRHFRILLPLFLLAGLAGCATQTTGPSDGIVSSRSVTADGTWLTLSNGCKLLDPANNVPADVTVVWSGTCVGNQAEGKGNLSQTWSKGTRWAKSEAVFSQGRRSGVWSTENSNGSKQVRSYKEGKLHGLSAQLNANGTYQEYFFASGQRIMSWLVAFSYPNGRWCSGECQNTGTSKDFVIVVRAEGKEPMTRACGTDPLECRRTVRSIVKETMRRVLEKSKESSTN